MSAPILPPVQLVPSFKCVICELEWPGHLTTLRGEDRLCCPCNSKLREDRFLKQNQHKLNRNPKKNGSSEKGKSSAFVGWSVALLVAASVACGSYVGVDMWEKAHPPADVGVVMLESQLPLKSGATIVNTAFLLEGASGPVAVVPAAILPDATDTPVFDKWKFVPANALVRAVLGKGLSSDFDPTRPTNLWVVECNPASLRDLPVTILQPQRTAVESGTRARLVRGAMLDGKPSQEITPAKVEAVLGGGTLLKVSFKTRVPAKGLLGAALVNGKGELMGVVDSLTESPDAAGLVASVKALTALELLGLQPEKR